MTALELCQQARTLWLSAAAQDHLDHVEDLYRQALNSKQKASNKSSKTPLSKKRKTKRFAELTAKEYRETAEKLSLLYCQSGRTQKAKKGLHYLGFVCRLAKPVLDYPTFTSKHNYSSTKIASAPPSPCGIYDDFLHPRELQQLQSIFQNPEASYWTNHNYQVEPPSPYFSYVIPLNNSTSQRYGFVGGLVEKVWNFPHLNTKFPALKSATFVEIWAHNRPHASGHQMHFDSDDEGRGGVRNPIMSTILYIDSSGGGPSLVTNQTLESTTLATKAWLAHPQSKRLVAFDGKVLHGVVPGKGVSTGRRVTLMFAFWKTIRIRTGERPGSARLFPATRSDHENIPKQKQPKWAVDLVNPSIKVKMSTSTVKEEPPTVLRTVYETLDGAPWKPKYGMPEYEQVFQGF